MAKSKSETAATPLGREIQDSLKKIRSWHKAEEFAERIRPLIKKLEGSEYDDQPSEFYMKYLIDLFRLYVKEENAKYLTAVFCAPDMYSDTTLKARREHFYKTHTAASDAVYAPWMLNERDERTVNTWENKLLARLGDDLAAALKEKNNHLGIADSLLFQDKPVTVSTNEKNQKTSFAFHNIPSPMPYFTGREELLSEIENGIRNNDSHLQILSGMPGVGKTQLARQFAYNSLGDYDIVAYIEDDGVEDDKIENFLYGLGVDVGDKPVSSVFRNFFEQYDGRWLLVLDNMDFFDTETASAIDDFLPKRRQNGHILITTQCHMPIYGCIPLRVPVFTDSESLDFMEEILGGQDKDVCTLIAGRLGNHPLALAVASETIARTPGLTCGNYYKNLLKYGIYYLDDSHGIMPGGYKKNVSEALLGTIIKATEKKDGDRIFFKEIESFLYFSAYLPAKCIDLNTMAEDYVWLPPKVDCIGYETRCQNLLRFLISHSLCCMSEPEAVQPGRMVLVMHPLLQEAIDKRASDNRLYWISVVSSFYRSIRSRKIKEEYEPFIKQLDTVYSKICCFAERVAAWMNPKRFSWEEKERMKDVLLGKTYDNLSEEKADTAFLHGIIERTVSSNSIIFFTPDA